MLVDETTNENGVYSEIIIQLMNNLCEEEEGGVLLLALVTEPPDNGSFWKEAWSCRASSSFPFMVIHNLYMPWIHIYHVDVVGC